MQLWTLVVGGLMAIITGALSAFLTYYLGQRGWESNLDYQQRAAVLQKRLDLIERTAQLIGRAPGMEDVWEAYLKEIGRTAIGNEPSHDPAISTKLGEYNGEFRAILELDSLFFGPKTRAVIATLKGANDPLPYWKFPSANLDGLLSAMGSELQAAPVGQPTETGGK
jgi:hypothetical protein